MARKSKDETAREMLTEIQERYERALNYESENRDLAVADLRFVYDEDGQWEERVLRLREGRPNYTFNRVLGSVNQVVGDQRQNRPSVKVRAVDSEADPEIADVFGGLIRNIEAQSDAETAYDTAFKFAAAGGFGAWRVYPKYVNENSFDQEICIERIPNPFTVYLDPTHKDLCGRDGNWAILTETINEDDFLVQYPKAQTSSIDLSDNDHRWFADDEIRIAEYYKKVNVDGRIALLSDGRVVEADADFQLIRDELEKAGITVVRERDVKVTKIEWCKVSGAEILEGPITYDWRFIPVVPVYGREINLEGEHRWYGLVRHSKDAQRSYNYNRSTMAETVAMQPKSPYLVTARQVKGHEREWGEVHRRNLPYLKYNPDARVPNGKPNREPPPDVPGALISLSQLDAEDIKATTGYYDASLGARSNETSGVAIRERNREGDVGSFEIIDNLAKSIKYTGEILVDMIPTIYDTERQLRILGIDGADEFVMVNQETVDEETGKAVILNDLRQGRYDVAVDVGPSYTTRRQEATDTILQLVTSVPAMGEFVLDLLVKNMDIPGADEIVERLRKQMIAAGTVEPTEEEQEKMGEPDPMMQAQRQAQMQMLMAGVQKAEAEAAKLGAQAKGAEAEALMGPAKLQKLIAEAVKIEIESMMMRETPVKEHVMFS